jgi:hypothetical protein
MEIEIKFILLGKMAMIIFLLDKMVKLYISKEEKYLCN